MDTSLRRSGETSEGEGGLLAQIQGHLIGHKSSRWLEENKHRAFGVVDAGLKQIQAVQSEVQSIMDNMDLEIFPTQMIGIGEDRVAVEMDRLSTLRMLVGMLAEITPVIDRMISTRNKVAMGATNILTAAVMGSNAIRMQSMRQERSANPAPRKRYGVDKLVIEGDAEVVGEA